MPDPHSSKSGISKFGRSAMSGMFAAIILSSLASITNLSNIPAYSQLQEDGQGDFVDSTVTGSLDMPTAMVFAPDGRLFISEKDGTIRVVKDGALLSAPFASLPVNSKGERGLLGIAFDPDFVSNHHLYVYYTTSEDPVHNRVSRLTADPANPDLVLAGSELPILDLEPLVTSAHNGGALEFGPDGKLYVATGDNYTRENAQKLTTRLGKILRINPDGSIPEDNPFFNAPGDVRKEIWALGLRNPFTFAFSPVVEDGGKMYINDVGNDWAEEINVGAAGANYGWPRCEGACLNLDFVDPLYAYTHEDGSGKAITGGAFYEGNQFPAEYRGSYFFGDYVLGFIKRLTPDGQVMDFQNAFSPVDIDISPDGSLYYLSIGEGAVHRVQYVRHEDEEREERNGTPIAKIVANPASGMPPLPVAFDGSTSTDPEQDELFYRWDFGDGSEASSGATVTHTYEAGGSYVATLLVDDGKGGTSSATASIVAGNLPIAMINSPAEGARYSAGDTIFFSGASRDKEDGILPDSAFSWQVVLHHNTHTHPFTEFEGEKSGNFTVPKVMETAADVWFRVHLSVKDSAGLVGTDVTDIHPERAEVVINSNVHGAQIMLDGQPKTTPHSFTGVTGVTRTLQASAEQIIDGQVYWFKSWSDGGEPMHTIDTPADNATYTAEYVTLAGAAFTRQNSIATSSTIAANTGVYFPLLAPPGPLWANMLTYRQAHPGLPWIAVVDPHHGPGEVFDANYADNVEKLQSANVTVLGYVSTLWAQRDPELVRQDIGKYKDWYNVDGILLDEMVSFPGAEGLYSGLTDHARSLGMNAVIGNVGTNTLPSYVGIVDAISTVEGDRTPPLSWLKGWQLNYDRSNFLYITYGQSWINPQYLAESTKYVGWLYITDDTMPFPYDDFPAYFDEIVAVLDPQGNNSLRNLSVRASDLLGESLSGISMTVSDETTDAGAPIATLPAPLTHVGTQESTYTVTARGNSTHVFDHWEDGSTNPARNVTLDSSKLLRAYYRTPSTPDDLQSNIVVNSLTVNGGLLEMWTSIVADDGEGNAGITPLAFAGQEDKTYTVTVDNFQGLVFDHWEDGSTNRTRTVSLQGDNKSAYLTAYYRVESVPGLVDVTVDAYTLDGTEVRGLWSTIEPLDGEASGGHTPATYAATSGVAYAVAAHDSDIYVFDHWEDGSTNRTRTVTAISDTTLTAYYRTSPAVLTVKSADLSGSVLNGMYATVVPINNSTIKAAFTNSAYVGYVGSAYKVTASDYAGMAFDHWEDGTTSRSRTIMLYGDRDITAYYNTGNSVMALTPAVHVSKDEGADLTVNTVSLDGADLNMWSIVQPQGAGRYTVFVHDYDGYTFDHWEDGSTNRTRTLTIEEATTIIAYYSMG